MSHKKINPKGWKPARGYANAILSEGLTLNIAGQIGWNENQEFISKDFLGQMEQTLKNISVIVEILVVLKALHVYYQIRGHVA